MSRLRRRCRFRRWGRSNCIGRIRSRFLRTFSRFRWLSRFCRLGGRGLGRKRRHDAAGGRARLCGRKIDDLGCVIRRTYLGDQIRIFLYIYFFGSLIVLRRDHVVVFPLGAHRRIREERVCADDAGESEKDNDDRTDTKRYTAAAEVRCLLRTLNKLHTLLLS